MRMLPLCLSIHRLAVVRRNYLNLISTTPRGRNVVRKSIINKGSNAILQVESVHRQNFVCRMVSSGNVRNKAKRKPNDFNSRMDLYTSLMADKAEIESIKSIFPNPSSTLHNLSSMMDKTISKINFKESSNRIIKNKVMDTVPVWTCTITLLWPKEKSFVRKASTKSVATKDAAALALNHLLKLGVINKQGLAVHSGESINNLMMNLNPPIRIELGNDSSLAISSLVDEYKLDVEKIFNDAKTEFIEKPRHNNEHLETTSELLEDAEQFQKRVNGPSGTSEQEIQEDGLRDVITGIPCQEIDILKADKDKSELILSLERILSNPDKKLPIDEYASVLQERLQTLEGGVTVIVGAPGCGKSTRAPLWGALYDKTKNARVIVTEPRKVAASSLAARVAVDIGEPLGMHIGYKLRLQSKTPQSINNCIMYCTTGMLINKMLNNPNLIGCTHVFVDEAHERDVNTDLLLLMLKRAMAVNKELKVIIMSATIDTDVFTEYFGDCPVFEIPGHMFPVTKYHLEDMSRVLGNIYLPFATDASSHVNRRPNVDPEEVAKVIRAVDHTQPDGAILVFLPGWKEIKRTSEILTEFYQNSSQLVVVPVHSLLDIQEQDLMFKEHEPGVRKVVLATNIAETSITIPDAVYVIDTGASKQFCVRGQNGISSLQTEWISRSSMDQRAGRAGRVKPGVAFRLYTADRMDTLPEYPIPKIKTVPLEKTILDCKLFFNNGKAMDYLSQLPEPPSKSSIYLALEELREIGALNPQEELTGLGRLISQITLQPRLSKSLVYSVLFRTLQPILNNVAYVSNNVEIFSNLQNRKREVRALKRKYQPVSDHLAIHWLIEDYCREERDGNIKYFCDRNSLNGERLTLLKALRHLYLEHLSQLGLITESQYDRSGAVADDLNSLGAYDEVTKAVLFAGTNSVIKQKVYLKTMGKLSKLLFLESSGIRTFISAESCNSDIYSGHLKTDVEPNFALFTGTDSRITSEGSKPVIFAHYTSMITPLSVVLMSEGDVVIETSDQTHEETGEKLLNIKIIKHELTMQCSEREAELIMSLRSILRNSIDYFIEYGGIYKKDESNKLIVDSFMKKTLTCLAKILTYAETKLTITDDNENTS